MLVGWGLSLAAPHVPRTLAELEWFRVRELRVEGIRYITADEVERIAAVPIEANIWDDPSPIEARVRAHPLVGEASVVRRIPGTLVVRIEEREPVALLPTPALEPVDRDGRRLPLDPARLGLDLPLIQPRRSHPGAATAAALAPATREIARLAEVDPTLWANLSVVTTDGAHDVELELADPAVRLLTRIPLTPVRLREALAVLSDATGRTDEPPATLDLRFADQVVVRRGEAN